MGLAGRKGKFTISEDPSDACVAAWERYEDVLTGDVFGAYRYLPPCLGLLPLLVHAIDEAGQSFTDFLSQFGIELASLDIARIRLWPTFENGREPDVFVLMESSQHQQSVALLVEAKLHSPQHQIGEHSQLGHYLIQHIADAYADGCLAWDLPDHPRPLLFITKHQEIPAPELAQARDEIRNEVPSLIPQNLGIFWTNWGRAGLEAERLWRENRIDVDSKPWLRHLLDLHEEIRHRDLLPRPPFDGIAAPHFLNLPKLGALSGIPRLSEAIASGVVGDRRYLANRSACFLDNNKRYCRNYQRPSIPWKGAPRTYTKLESETK